MLRRILNPLQWNFGPRTTATLLTWAVVPLLLGAFAVWRSLTATAAEIGIAADQVDTLVQAMMQTLLTVSIPLLIICLIAAVIFSWAVVQPLWDLRKAMKAIEQGDLSQGPVRVRSHDEVGQITRAFNAMAISLHTMVRDMAATAGELSDAGTRLQEGADASARSTSSSTGHIRALRESAEAQVEQAVGGTRAMGEIRTAAEQVAGSAEAQSREVGEASNTVQQVATAAEQVASSAGVVAEAASNTRMAAEAGGKAVQNVVESMDRVRSQVLEASRQIQNLSESMAHVDEILQLIAEIADQTDLLALNAAIEAARVGEHGRGFAVVAGEVRRLADRSRKAAGEIAARIESLRHEASGVVATMETGTDEVNHGAVLVRDAGASLDRILEAVAATQRQVESISAATQEIAAASNQVVMVTHSLSAIAEENAATSEEMLAGVQGVVEMIEDMEQKAKDNQMSVAPLAAASTQMQSAVEEMVACAAQIIATSSKLQEHVDRFRLS